MARRPTHPDLDEYEATYARVRAARPHLTRGEFRRMVRDQLRAWAILGRATHADWSVAAVAVARDLLPDAGTPAATSGDMLSPAEVSTATGYLAPSLPAIQNGGSESPRDDAARDARQAFAGQPAPHPPRDPGLETLHLDSFGDFKVQRTPASIARDLDRVMLRSTLDSARDLRVVGESVSMHGGCGGGVLPRTDKSGNG